MIYYSNTKQVRVDYYSRILQNSKKNTKVLYTIIQRLSGDTLRKVLPSKYVFYFYFYLYIYPPDSQESGGGANT